MKMEAVLLSGRPSAASHQETLALLARHICSHVAPLDSGVGDTEFGLDTVPEASLPEKTM